MARLYSNLLLLARSTDRAEDLRLGLMHARRSVEIDGSFDLGHGALGILLALSGQERDGREALERSLALNPNFAIAHHWIAIASIFSATPDPPAILEAERIALRLNPKDPLTWGFYTGVGHAYFIRNLDPGDENAREAYEAACRYSNVEYFPFLFAAVSCVAAGRTDAAKRYLGEALKRRPDLTLAKWREAYNFPIWPKMIAAQDPSLETLVALGLPRE